MQFKQIILFFLPVLLLLSQPTFGQISCDSCAISLPDTLAADTLFLSMAPDGQTGVFYDGSISFRVPKTTTPVSSIDPDTPPGLTISQLTINTLTNLPPGLEWEASQTTFDPAEETDGCIQFCGTPLQPGLYMVDVVLTATIFVVDETASFTFPILILPAESNTDGFSMTNNSGCGEITVAFTNNVPSNAQDGFSYFWDFGNMATSIDENPTDQTYTEPGVYTVNYEAVVDTSGYFLTNILVESAACNDLIGKPDLKIDVIDPNDSLIFVTPILMNMDPPVSWSFNIELGPGNYQIKVVDNDSGLEGADDICGTFNINQNTNGILTDGETTIDLTIIHPIDTIVSVDSVIVFEQPADPENSNVPNNTLCEGDTFLLSTNYEESIQWYQDTVPILEATTSELSVEEDGVYWVTYTSPDGCTATSESSVLSFAPVPDNPVFTNDNNLLTLFNPDILPAQFALQWYLEGEAILDATTEVYCIAETGNYGLELTDLSSGCNSFYDIPVTYNPNFENCISATADELGDLIEGFTVFPNPVRNKATLTFNALAKGILELEVMNILGKRLNYQSYTLLPGNVALALDLNDYVAGTYFLRLKMEGKQKVVKLIKG